jgi:hypothetical protein
MHAFPVQAKPKIHLALVHASKATIGSSPKRLQELHRLRIRVFHMPLDAKLLLGLWI